MLLRNPAVPVDEDGDRNAPQRPERVLHVVASRADEHRVIHLHPRRVRLQLVDGIVHGDAEDDDVFAFLAVLRVELDQRRNLRAARSAPRRPEIQHDRLALERVELHVDAVHVLQREGERRGLARGLRVGRRIFFRAVRRAGESALLHISLVSGRRRRVVRARREHDDEDGDGDGRHRDEHRNPARFPLRELRFKTRIRRRVAGGELFVHL
ncbi:MAG: hypothetical protein DMF88_07000 [Acidobacteria bacterium]|nr:MAG: hypothetical protein DMF88_07000 [Acidobacteriota bacterium]